MIEFKKLRNQKEFVEEVLEKSNVTTACIIGFFGAFAFPVISMITRFAQGKNLPNEMQRLFTRDLIVAGLFFIGSVLITYIAIRIFRGKKAFKPLLIAFGWGGLYGIVLSLLLLPISLAGSFIKPGSQPNMVILVPILMCALSLIIIGFYAIKYEITAIKTIFNFGLIRAVIIWILTFIPTFMIYSENTKLTEDEKHMAGFSVPIQSIDTTKVIKPDLKKDKINE